METVNGAGIPVETSVVLFDEAYGRLLPEMQSLSEDELIPINRDIPTIVATALGVQPKLTALADELVKLAHLNAERVLKVDLYARALAHAHSLCLMAVDRTDALRSLTEEGTALREVLLADAHALTKRKLLTAEHLRGLTGPVGYKNLAFDLHLLGALFDAHYAKIQGKSGVTKAEIVRAQKIAADMLTAVGLRERAAQRISEAADMRVRAFTLFIRAYDEARRAMMYLRWHEGDADVITPSLYMNRGRRKVDRAAARAASAVAAPTASDHELASVTSESATAASSPTPGPEVGLATPPSGPSSGVGSKTRRSYRRRRSPVLHVEPQALRLLLGDERGRADSVIEHALGADGSPPQERARIIEARK